MLEVVRPNDRGLLDVAVFELLLLSIEQRAFVDRIGREIDFRRKRIELVDERTGKRAALRHLDVILTRRFAAPFGNEISQATSVEIDVVGAQVRFEVVLLRRSSEKLSSQILRCNR